MKTGSRFWMQRGFLPSEASAFKDITTESIEESQYISQMIQDRVKRYLRAGRDGLTSREYYFRIRKHYVDLGLASNTNILANTTKGRSQTFKLFNYYKDQYGIRDKNGKLVETPRKKIKISKKPITRQGTVAQTIRKHQDEIDRLRSRLGFPLSESQRDSILNQINNHTRKINELRNQ